MGVLIMLSKNSVSSTLGALLKFEIRNGQNGQFEKIKINKHFRGPVWGQAIISTLQRF